MKYSKNKKKRKLDWRRKFTSRKK